MGHVIRIDDDVWNYLNEKARELGMVYKSPNAVLRAVLGLSPKEERLREPRGRPATRPPTR